MLFQRILMMLKAALNIFLAFSTNTSRKYPVLITNHTHPIWSSFILLFHWYLAITFPLSSDPFQAVVPALAFLSVFYVGVFGFYFTSCSKDLHCELGRRMRRDFLSNKPILPFSIVSSAVLITLSSILLFFPVVHIYQMDEESALFLICHYSIFLEVLRFRFWGASSC